MRPVLCLPGLTRNGRDFHDLALAMAATGRTVHTLDARGRGHSDWDKDWRNYTIPYEAQDVLDVIMALSLAAPAIVGTSRGGLVAMVMAALQPGAFGPVVLNDIGPVIETKGLTRIAGYIGRTGTPPTWEEAAVVVAAASRKAFPAVPDSQWAAVARQWFNDKDGRPTEGYDPALARTMSVKDGPPPALWAQYLAFGARPVLVIRGERSDILSDATLAEMQRRLPQCRTLTVAGQGHAPLLCDAPTIAAIIDFLAGAEAAGEPTLRAEAVP
ncbi:MAG: alpha/beta fold hydrolase [Hyphomicrobiaceae bacterium]